MEKYTLDTSEGSWLCEHYHRKHISREKGLKENRTKEEEFYEYEFQPSILRRYTGHFMEEEEKKKFYYHIKISDLMPVSKKECQCMKCGKKFPLHKIEQMKQIFKKMDELYDRGIFCLTDLEFLKLMEGMEPVWYRRTPEDDAEIIGIEDDAGKWTLAGGVREEEIEGSYAGITSFVNLPEIKLRNGKEAQGCSHFRGQPYVIMKAKSTVVQPRIEGKAESILYTSSKGRISCRRCGKEFTKQEQEKLDQLIAYLNTPHYWLKEDSLHHKEWEEVLKYYDHGYLKANDPFGLFSMEKVRQLWEGVEPVLYRCENSFYKSRRKILALLQWKNERWLVRNKLLVYLKITFYV